MPKYKYDKTTPPSTPPYAPLVIELGHGTPFGIHYWMGWWDCAKRAHLNTEHREELITLPSSMPEWVQIGNVVHGLLAQHYRAGLFNMDHVIYRETIDPKVRQKAEEVYRAYRLRFAPDELGTIRAVEAVYGVATSQRKAVAQAVNAYPLPFTFGPDLETVIDKKRAAALRKTRNVTVKPGLWLTDHKSVGWVKNEDRYVQGLQPTAYMVAHAGLFGRKPEGMLINIIPRDGRDYRMLVVPFPNAVKIQRLHHFFDMVREKREKMGAVWTNPAMCVDSRDPCIWWERGVCYGV